MPSAKKDFIDRVRTLNTTINNTEALSSKALMEIEHNEIARMLRNGLAVVGFAALEDFIKKRSSEAMSEISNSSVLFSDLPERIQTAATYEAISALSYQLSIRDKSEKIDYVQEHSLKIASTATAHYEITPHSFGYNQANINDEAIKKILSSFHINDPWQQMTSIASRLSLTALPLQESYKNAASRRHKAAHVATADTPHGDISQFVKEAFAIAISFDSLLSMAIRTIKSHDSDYLKGLKPLKAEQVKFRFIRFSNNRWKDIVEGSNRAYRTSNDLDSLRIEAKNRATILKQIYIEFDQLGLISNWECN